ncbi:hypothetical protein LR48_Vigan03g110800 [Vigna angularis]|uniref:Uncharacterized protein n=1 Tax=Phaseolus angularis TaxID=3914 RepID=A0A0L9U4M0_PHAAN|nr:hypothetical protein LR48_Vigan03g110800 [Vigna angularis]
MNWLRSGVLIALSGMASSSGKRIKTIGSKRKDKKPERSYASKFLSRKHERHFNSLHRGQVTTTEMIIGMYDTPPGHRWTMDEFNNVVTWPEEQAQGSGAGAAEVLAIDDDDDEFEDVQDDGEEEDSDDSMG